MKKLKLLDLFSGIGGFSLGLESTGGFETVAFCEFDKHAQAVLDKHWPEIKIYDDVRTLNAKQYRGSIDVVCGGFPCQDLSVAGNKKGITEGKRSNLYVEMLRVISECLPRYAVFENVTGLLTGESGRWFAKFLYDLAQVGYDAEWHCIPASELGANHHRDRVYVVAYPYMQRRERSIKDKILREPRLQIELVRSFEGWPTRQDIPSPKLSGGNDGVPKRLDRLRRLGNSVAPAVPKIIGEAILRYEVNQGAL
jgi:DNA (cytosine-5)-methyltransferase 1